MTTEWRVVANYWKANQGWTHEEEVDTLTDYMSAEMYVDGLIVGDLVNYFRTTGADAIQFDIIDEDGNKVSDYWLNRDDVPADEYKLGVITVDDFCKAVDEFGFESPVVTALWNTMNNNPNSANEFETVYAMWAAGRFKN